MNRRRRMDRTKTCYGTLQSIPGTVERNNKGHKTRDHTIQVKPYTRTDAKDADREQRRIQTTTSVPETISGRPETHTTTQRTRRLLRSCTGELEEGNV